MKRVVGIETKTIYFEGTHADCSKWICETYPSELDEKGYILNEPMQIVEVW